MNAFLPVTELLREYDRALAYTDDLWCDLSPDEVTWRPHETQAPSAGTSATRPMSPTS